jgi:Bacterial toxin 50
MTMIDNPYKHYKEYVDFEERIGIWNDKSGKGLDKDTNFGIIHYSKEGAHIVPCNPHRDSDFINIAFIRSSIQVALLGCIIPKLRAVSIELKINEINLFFYYDDLPLEDEEELANLAHTEFISDFPFLTKSDFQMIHLPRNNPIPKQAMLVYLRYES